MSKPIIEISDIGKRYRIAANRESYKSLRDEVIKFISPSARRTRKQQDDFWALKDVSFSVREGEAIGIIGRNGAGKSTLLKILSQITPPTEGRITLRGRVASLLEVGTGFHPELTGRENIFLNGTILGMSRKEVKRRFDEIVAFAEVEKFIDTPVKRYSSGMYVRLAFAVAAHLEPEILIVDEVLAVGDAEFQNKCLGKMEEVARGGRTVLFVSHNMTSIQQLCDRCIVLSSGELFFIGDVPEAINCYFGHKNFGNEIISHLSNSHSSLIISSVNVNGSASDVINLLPNQEVLNVEITGEISESIRIDIEVIFYDYQGIPLAIFSPGHERGPKEITPEGNFLLSSQIQLPRLVKGSFSASISLIQPGIKYLAEMPESIIIHSPGISTSTGIVLDYKDRIGWQLLAENKK